MKKQTKKEIAVKPLYKLSLLVNGETLTSEGKTLLEAVEALKMGTLKTKGVVKVSGEGNLERLLTIRQMSKLFGGGTGFGARVARISAVKFLSTLIKK